MDTFSVGSAIRFGWETFKKRPWFFIGAILCVFVASWIGSAAASAFGNEGAGAFAGALINATVGFLVGMGEVAFFLKAARDPASVSIPDLWHPRPFWKYVGTAILTALVVVIGLILLIVPGIIFALMFMFGYYFVIDKNLGPIEALKSSKRITKGHLGKLALFALAIAGLNLLGVVCLIVGLLVSMPVSMLAMARAYIVLSGSSQNA